MPKKNITRNNKLPKPEVRQALLTARRNAKMARSAHAYCYMKGLTPWRSLSFLIGLLGNLLMALPLLPHLWS